MKHQVIIGVLGMLVAALTVVNVSAQKKKQPTQEEVHHTIAVLEKRVVLQEKKINDVTEEMLKIDQNLER